MPRLVGGCDDVMPVFMLVLSSVADCAQEVDIEFAIA